MTATAVEFTRRDYSLVGRDTKYAEESGLASAEWYHCPVSRKELKDLMQRSDQPAELTVHQRLGKASDDPHIQAGLADLAGIEKDKRVAVGAQHHQVAADIIDKKISGLE